MRNAPPLSQSGSQSRPQPRAPRARRAALCLCAAIAAGQVACARPTDAPISAADFDRDRGERAALTAAIAEDHRALAELIAADRFVDAEAIYADPELREIALRLIDRTRALRRLADTDVLAPSMP